MINTPGTYIMRGGQKAVIFEITEKGTFPCKGYIIGQTKKGKTTSTYSIWKPTGQWMAVGESNYDIIGTYND